jgi:Icc-related predicted phosphoesterase
LFFVRGNHDKVIEYSTAGQRTAPHGGFDLHSRLFNYKGLLIAGVEGSPRYRPGPFQYSQSEMWRHVLWLAPRLLYNRLRCGRALDVFASHAPPAGIHEGTDFPHRGITAFRWLDTVFKPAVHLHGHVHIYSPKQPVETALGRTRVINAFGFREATVEVGGDKE